MDAVLYDVLYEMLIQRWLNAGAVLELLAITASAPGQHLALTPLFTLLMQVYWNGWKANLVHVRIQQTCTIYLTQFLCYV